MKVTQMWIDENTGEVLKATPGVFIPQENREKQQKYLRIKERFKEQGQFVWMFYKKAEELKVPVSAANLTRLVFLSTFMNYDNRLILDKPTNSLNIEEAMSKDQLMKTMCLPKNTFYRFYNEITDAGILIEKENGYFLNEEFFKKGTIKRKDTNGRMRFYIWGIRNLYLKADLRDHKMLGYGFMIMPYVSVEYNIVCWNPDERDVDRIKPIGVTDMMEIFGYDLSHANRFKKKLMDVIVGKYQLIHLVDNEKMFVSPHIYYAGTDRKQVEALGCFDDIEEVNRKKNKR